eukprot:g7882.t1
MAAAADGREADRSPNSGEAGGDAHRSNRRAGREVRGYDVSAVSGEEVVELSSWEAESTTSVGGRIPEARQRSRR